MKTIARFLVASIACLVLAPSLPGCSNEDNEADLKKMGSTVDPNMPKDAQSQYQQSQGQSPQMKNAGKAGGGAGAEAAKDAEAPKEEPKDKGDAPK
jgi:hypothetical protein